MNHPPGTDRTKSESRESAEANHKNYLDYGPCKTRLGL